MEPVKTLGVVAVQGKHKEGAKWGLAQRMGLPAQAWGMWRGLPSGCFTVLLCSLLGAVTGGSM